MFKWLLPVPVMGLWRHREGLRWLRAAAGKVQTSPAAGSVWGEAGGQTAAHHRRHVPDLQETRCGGGGTGHPGYGLRGEPPLRLTAGDLAPARKSSFPSFSETSSKSQWSNYRVHENMKEDFK